MLFLSISLAQFRNSVKGSEQFGLLYNAYTPFVRNNDVHKYTLR